MDTFCRWCVAKRINANATADVEVGLQQQLALVAANV
jgi:hypothetical protein